jgi:purine nucleosidase
VLGHPAGEVTLVPTGPLTNIALAARIYPEIVSRVGEVVFMGGAYAGGNITPVAEFNIYADPEAAHIVLSEDWPVTMIGLDLTHQAVATDSVRARISGIGNDAARFVSDLLNFLGESYSSSIERKMEPPVHDPCAVMRVIAPEIIDVARANVEVELHGNQALGLTVTDFLGRDHVALRTNVGTRLNAHAFWDRIIESISRLPRSAPGNSTAIV